MIATKSEKLKMALTSTPMILLYVIVAFCVVAAIREPAFISPATAIRYFTSPHPSASRWNSSFPPIAADAPNNPTAPI